MDPSGHSLEILFFLLNSIFRTRGLRLSLFKAKILATCKGDALLLSYGPKYYELGL